jgi:redox-sensitive bicupin YhaK (pirin superfamily)
VDPAIELVIQGRPRAIGALSITRILPEARRRHVGPFVFLDHMGPIQLPPGEGVDVPPHPHIGLSTVTYLYEGELMHRDSVGSEQAIAPGAINLMRAGRGIAHSERSLAGARASGARLHGLQLWVALPFADEEGAPGFAHHGAETLPAWDEDGVAVRLLMGALGGRESPVEDPSRPFFADLTMPAGTTFTVPGSIPECAVYVATGALTIASARELVVRAPGQPLRLEATAASRIALLGGAPLDAPRFMEWNYVSSSKERIARASEAWQAGEFPAVAGED